MKINPTPLGVLLGTVYYPREARSLTKVLNYHDGKLLKSIAATWDQDSPHIFSTKPLLSTDLYYSYLLGSVYELTPAGMFAEPEKSQVYLDLLAKGCIGASPEALDIATLGYGCTYKDITQTWVEAMLHANSPALAIKDMFESVRRLNKDLFGELTSKDTTYITIGGGRKTYKPYRTGEMHISIIVSSLGEIIITCEILNRNREKSIKPRSLILYVSTDASIHVMTDGRSTKEEVKSQIKNLIYGDSITNVGANIHKLILVKILFNILETSGDLFDFAMDISREQKCQLVKEGILAGLSSSIKPTQDGSITDLLGCIAEKVTYGSYYKGKLVNTKFSKLRSSAVTRSKHETE